jgi:ABC-type Mn2+/Zn2+ transport system ATPase subunit
MDAVVWLEDYLSKWDKILFMVSHSQDFMNTVCTHIVHLKNKKLMYYSGNYDSFVQTRTELEEEQNRKYNWEQEQIKQMKDYVARFGHGTAKLARQAQSKEKILDKMVRSGLTEKVEAEKALDFKFGDPGKLAPPVLQLSDVGFGYPGCPLLYEAVELGVDLDSRVALVGPNGAGKSTLLKLMTGDLIPVQGAVRPHTNLRISKFSQHFVDVLDLSMCPLDYFMQLWTEMPREEARRCLGRFGISGSVQTQVMSQLSDGQKSRVVLAKMARENPHILFLDEPTNHLDMESIDSLAKAINNFTGGVVLVSHDMRLISQVAKEIWLCDNRTVTRYQGEISDFKIQLRRQMQQQNLIDADGKAAPVKIAPPAPVKVAPPVAAAPTSSKTPAATASTATKSTKKSSEDDVADEVMKARMELAEIAIQKQRARQAEKDKKDQATASQEAAEAEAPAIPAPSGAAPDANEPPKEMTERERKKLLRQQEKEAAIQREKEMEEERARRRAEKLKDMEDAIKLREAEDKARAERQKEREEKAARKKAEEDAIAAEQLAAKMKRREEKEAKRREREARREAENEARRKAWDDAARADPWTQEQQNILEDALLKWDPFSQQFNSAEDEKSKKWTFVAKIVGNKTRNQCLSRYRFLKQMVQDMKQEISLPDDV